MTEKLNSKPTRAAGGPAARARGLSLAVLFMAGSLAAGSRPPAWLQQAATQPAPENWAEASAVVLFDEKSYRVEDGGKTTVLRRFAVRIQQTDGSGHAAARVVYVTDGEKVKDLEAWLIPPEGKAERFRKKEAVDVSLADNDVYNEARVLVLSARSKARPGSVFGFESKLERKTVFTQFEETLQESGLPTLVSRVRLTLPEGWRAQPTWFNEPESLDSRDSGDSWLWQAEMLEGIPSEPARPPLSALSPRLAVSYFPAPGDRAAGPSFSTWNEVSAWMSRLNDSQVAPRGEIAARARSLAGKATDEWELLRELGGHAQKVNYVSIQTGIGRGGGYRPRPASEVLSKNYGDCKDKTNLLRSLLGAVDVESYAVAIYSGNPDYVREEWPSPQQFNHAITAIRVSDGVEAPAVKEHSRLGRLLFFDPTDPVTPLGLLPESLQGSLGLVLAGDSGVLLPMPELPPGENVMERKVEAELWPDGSLSARLREDSRGTSAVREKKLLRRYPEAEYRGVIAHWILRGVPGAKMKGIAPEAGDDSFSLQVEFTAGSYAQLVQGRVLIFKPALVGRRERHDFTAAQRTLPVALEAESFREESRFALPAGFEVDETPEPLDLEESFGSYASSYQASGDHLVFRRSLTLRRGRVPPEEYPALRGFFEKIRNVEQAPVVLVR